MKEKLTKQPKEKFTKQQQEILEFLRAHPGAYIEYIEYPLQNTGPVFVLTAEDREPVRWIQRITFNKLRAAFYTESYSATPVMKKTIYKLFKRTEL